MNASNRRDGCRARSDDVAPQSGGEGGIRRREPGGVQAARVGTIHMQATDPLGNGVLWASVTCSVGGALSCVANPRCIGDDGGGAVTAILAALGVAAGAGIGLGVDAALKGAKLLVYAAPEAPGGGRPFMAPMIAPRAKGVTVSFTF